MNKTKEKQLLQTTKNSTTIIEKMNSSKNKKNQKRKYSNEKYKTDIIKQIYNKLFFYTNNNNQKNALNHKINNKSNSKLVKNQNKRNTNRNIIKNFKNSKNKVQKKNIPIPIRRNSKENLKIKTKLYSNYISGDISKNYLKQTNSTTEINLSIEEKNNLTIENNSKERKIEYLKIKKENNNDNFILLNIINNSVTNKSKIQINNNNDKKNLINKKSQINYNNYQKINNKTNSRILNIIETNLNYKKKKLNKNNDNKKNQKENSDDKNYINSSNKNIDEKKKKFEIPRKNRNNIFEYLKESKSNQYYLSSGNKLSDKDNSKSINKFNNSLQSISITNNKTFYIDKEPKNLDKIDSSLISRFNENSLLKQKWSYKHILLTNNDEIILNCDKKRMSTKKNIKKKSKDKYVSERKDNKFKNFIINKNLLINDKFKYFDTKNYTIYQSNKNINNYSKNYFKLKELKMKKPFLQNTFKNFENNDVNCNTTFQSKKINKIRNKSRQNNIFNNKENLNINIVINTNLISSKNIKKDYKYVIKNNNSNIRILETNNDRNNTSKKNISSNSKKLYSNNMENSTKKNIENDLVNLYIDNKEKNIDEIILNNKAIKDLNQKFFENYFDLGEDDKTDKEEAEIKKTPRINKLVTYFNDAKKSLKKEDLFYKSKNTIKFQDVISPNKSSNINSINTKIEDDESSNETIKIPIFEEVNLLNNLNEKNIKNNNFKIKNLYDLISKPTLFKLKYLFLNFLDDKSVIILSSINRQFYINLRAVFYNNIYRKIFDDKKNIFINKIKTSMFSYASNEIKNCSKIKLKQIYESFGNKKSIYDDLIIKDINRTFINDLQFNKNSEKYTKLYNLLTRYSNYNPSIGYAQGLNFIFANSLSYFDKEEEVFIFVDGLINLFKLENYMGENNSSLTAKIKRYSNIISKNIPDIIKFFEKKFLTHEFFSTGWILTLFSNAMNCKNLIIAWCFMIVFGWKFFYSFVIQILLFYKEEINKTNENNLSKKMKKLLKEERFNTDIRQIIYNTLIFMSQNIIL